MDIITYNYFIDTAWLCLEIAVLVDTFIVYYKCSQIQAH